MLSIAKFSFSTKLYQLRMMNVSSEMHTNLHGVVETIVLCVSVVNIVATLGQTDYLKEPPKVDLSTGGTIHLFLAAKEMAIPDEYGNDLGRFTTRVYCLGKYNGESDEIDTDSCDIPGPTWIFSPGTEASIVLHNNLKGVGINETEESLNIQDYKDPDITNIHTHGLHIDPLVDNIVDIKLQPLCNIDKGINPENGRGCVLPDIKGNGESHTYKYQILDIHYPGTHWYVLMSCICFLFCFVLFNCFCSSCSFFWLCVLFVYLLGGNTKILLYNKYY